MVKPMLYAFADEACREIDGQISAMLRNGLNGLEIRGVDGVNISRITGEKAKEVRKKLDDSGLITWSVGSPIGKIQIGDNFQTHLDVFRHTLEMADILGAKNLRLFSFYMPKNEDPGLYRQLVTDRMGAFCDIAAGTGVTLCHENEKGIFGDTADRCLQLHQALPELKCIFDPANYVQCGNDTLQSWELLRQYVRYLHIKDALSDGSVVPAGKGVGNVARIVKDYLALGGSALTIEPHLKVFDGLKGLEAPGNTSIIGKRYTYPSSDTAFDAACDALKEILPECKYTARRAIYAGGAERPQQQGSPPACLKRSCDL